MKAPDGQVFDSQKEYNRWCELRLLERAGMISGLSRQVKYVLIPTQRDKMGKLLERECAYYADFVYRQNGCLVAEDSKGHKTEAYRIKKKLMLWVHNIKIKET